MPKGIPLPGDRAVWDSAGWPDRHANDINKAGGMHHTLGTGENQAAAGDHSHDHFADTSNPHSVTKSQVGLGNVANILCNLAATAAPTANDDSADGYAVGSSWFDTTNDKAYLCLDATEGAAVWQEVGGGGGAALTVEEIDGTPSVDEVTTIKITNGTLTDDGDGVVTVDFGSAATDGAAIHDNVASEIHAITEKMTLADNDEFIIEDSADSYAKKRVKKSNLGASGGGFYYATPTKPVLSNFAWINQGTATATENGDGIYLLAPAVSGDQMRILKKAAPATPYKITAMFLPFFNSQNYNLGGLCWRQSSDGKLVTLDIAHNAGFKIESIKFNNPTTYSGAYFQLAFSQLSPFWLRMEDDGTNRKVYWSLDGYNFMQIHSVARTDFLTADEVGFYASSVNGTYPAAIKLLSWKEE